MRKRRNDRNHIIYKLTCLITQEFYIGITVVMGRAYKKSLNKRFDGHCRKAFIENKDFAISKALREHNPENFVIETLEIVRGKELAHKREKELIHELNPPLNILLKKKEEKDV